MRKDFCLCFNDAYVPYASVTIQSIVQHMGKNDDVHIHVISDWLSDDNMRFLSSLANVTYYLNSSLESEHEYLKNSIWGIYAWYRILLPSLLNQNIHRILYLDCDIIVNDGLDELFSIDISKVAIAACIDVQSYGEGVFRRLGYEQQYRYICSGVLLMNLDKWRTDHISEKILKFVKNNPNKIEFPDQDAINYICKDDKMILSPSYGVLVPFFREDEFIKEHINEMVDMIERPSIVHYAGYQPWIYCKNKSLHSYLWWNTYKSLHSFPQVKIDYYKSILRYMVRYLLSKLRLINKENKYHINQYYNHPRVTRKAVMQRINRLK